jgi:hypothetical protein
MRCAIFVGLAIGLAAGACKSEVSSEIFVDGAKFDASECRSGQAFGFSGIQLEHADGRRLRMIARADGSMELAVFPAGSDKGELFGECGTIVMEAQNSKINGIKNLEGTAQLACVKDGREIRGTVRFKNCH